MPFTATTLAAAGTVIGATGAIVSGVQASQSARFQADVAKQNARLSRERGAAEADRRRRSASRQLGGQRARGAQLDVLADAASELELDALLAEFEGELGARDATIQERAARSRGRNALISGGIGAVESGLSGLGNLGLLTGSSGPGIAAAGGSGITTETGANIDISSFDDLFPRITT